MRPVLGLLHPYSSEYMLWILGGSPSCDTCDVLLSLIIWLWRRVHVSDSRVQLHTES